MRESEVEAHLKHCAERLGGEVRKVKWIGRRGAPDRLVMLPGQPLFSTRAGYTTDRYGPPRTFYVELKRPGAKATPQQLREHERMRKYGLQVFVASTFEEVERLFA